MNSTGKIELREDNTFSITGAVPQKLQEYLHTKIEPSVEYANSSLVQYDKAEIDLLKAHHPELANELEALLMLWVDRIGSEAKTHKQKQFQLRQAFLKEECAMVERHRQARDILCIDYKGMTFDAFPLVFDFEEEN